VRHAFSGDLVLDVSAYNKDFISNPTYRTVHEADPQVPGATKDANVLTTADFGYARGIDVSVLRRIGTWFSASLAYTLQFAQSTGSSPFSYLNTSGRDVYSVLGTQVPPPEQPLPTDDNRTHNIVGTVTLQVPSDWKRGSALGNVLQGVGVFVTARAVSGLPYTLLLNEGTGQLAPFENYGLAAAQQGSINSSTMPWNKFVDLRLNKGVRIGRLDWTLYADIRNLFNFQNVIAVFAQTGDVTNPANRAKQTASEVVLLAGEASQNQARNPGDGSVILNGTQGAKPCANWSGDAGPVDCVLLQRTEARWGNGDGIFTTAEQQRALNAWYDAFNGPQRFYASPRQIRVGAELNF
jgi:hypothetical protein